MVILPLIVEPDESRARALATWLDEAGCPSEIHPDPAAAIARLQSGAASGELLMLDFDGAAAGEALSLLRSYRFSHALPPLLALAQVLAPARLAELLAEGVARVLSPSLPAPARRAALQEMLGLRRLVEGDEPLQAPGAAAGLPARLGLALSLEQQGGRLLQDCIEALLGGRAQAAAESALRLARAARQLGSQRLAEACGRLAGATAGTDALDLRVARVRLELDRLVNRIGHAALQPPGRTAPGVECASLVPWLGDTPLA